MKFHLVPLLMLVNFSLIGQTDESNLPYESIPDYPESYNAVTAAARMIDGLGYRYYWATEGLMAADLDYSPSETSRTTLETLKHIHGLSKTIVNATYAIANERSVEQKDLDYSELRKETLNNIHRASQKLKMSEPGDIEGMKVIFKRGEQTSEFPFWNMINGPIADALWHSGQVVAFRRASGNPINPNVSVLTGKTRN